MTPDPRGQAEPQHPVTPPKDPARVAIPEALAADVAARPGAYRPDVEDDTPVVVLGCYHEPHAIGVHHCGVTGPALHSWRTDRDHLGGVGTLTVGIDDAEVDSCEATAWALVGAAGVPDDHPACTRTSSTRPRRVSGRRSSTMFRPRATAGSETAPARTRRRGSASTTTRSRTGVAASPSAREARRDR